MAIDTAKAIGPLRQCDKAAIQKVNKVLIPPEDSVMDLVNNDKDLRLGHQAAVVIAWRRARKRRRTTKEKRLLCW